MPKWASRDAPRGRRFTEYKSIPFKKKQGHPTHTPKPKYPNGINHTFRLYEKKDTKLSRIPDDERGFFREWVMSRHIEEQYLLLSLSYWMRIRADIATMFLVKDKRLYMVACIHTALKWLGYDEVYKCNFIKDLRDIQCITHQDHVDLEFEILRGLSWDL